MKRRRRGRRRKRRRRRRNVLRPRRRTPPWNTIPWAHAWKRRLWTRAMQLCEASVGPLDTPLETCSRNLCARWENGKREIRRRGADEGAENMHGRKHACNLDGRQQGTRHYRQRPVDETTKRELRGMDPQTLGDFPIKGHTRPEDPPSFQDRGRRSAAELRAARSLREGTRAREHGHITATGKPPRCLQHRRCQ